MKKYLSIYKNLISMSIKIELEYRTNFIIGYLVEIGWMLVYLLFYKVVFLRTNVLAGWDYGSMLVFIGVAKLLSAFVYGAFVIWNFRNLPNYVREGTLDSFLLKPLNSQFYVTMGRPYPLSFLSTALPLFLIYWGFKTLGVVPSISSVVVFVFIFVCSVVINYAIWFITILPVFWTNRLFNIVDLFGEIRDISNYPLDIYTTATRLVFTFVIPFAFMTTFPAKALLGNFNWWWLPVAVFIAAVLLFVSNKLWNFALKHYSGASA